MLWFFNIFCSVLILYYKKICNKLVSNLNNVRVILVRKYDSFKEVWVEIGFWIKFEKVGLIICGSNLKEL